MSWKLLAGRFEGSDTSAAILEQFNDVQVEGVSWSLETFGLDRMEITVPAKSKIGAYQRYDTHIGQRMAIYSSDCRRPISGWITEARMAPGNRIRYVARGPGFRMQKVLIGRSWAATDDIQTVIAAIVAEFMPYCSSDTSHIAANTTPIGGWSVDSPTGSTPADAIRDLCNLSDSNYYIRDFWLVDEPFSGSSLGQFIPYYQARTPTVDAAWIVNTSDLKEPQVARSLENMVTAVRVYYGLVSGTITGLGTDTVEDTSAAFIDENVKPGDTIQDKTVGGDASILSVNSQTEITIGGWRAKHWGTCTNFGGNTALIDTKTDFVVVGAQIGDIIKNDTDKSTGVVSGISTTYTTNDTLDIVLGMSGGGGTDNSANERYFLYGSPTVGDDYAIRTAADYNAVEANTTTITNWFAEIAVNEPSMDATQAEQYANALLISEPQQVEPFTVGAPRIRNANGSLWPTWEPIAQAGRSIKIADLYPSAATLDGTADRRTVFYVTSLEYSDSDISLRVTVDAYDRRLDARLRRERIIGSAGLF